VEHTLNEAVSARGWDAVPEAQKEGVSRPAPAPPAYEDMLYDVYLAHGRTQGNGKKAARDNPAFRRFVESQLTWDRAMAQALAARVRREAGPLVVGIAGSGHLRHQYGIAHQLADLGVREVATLLPSQRNENCSELKTGLADAIFSIPRAPDEPPQRPRLGVELGGKNGTVEIVAVTPGSLAEQSNLRKGDRIVAIAGAAVKSAARVAAAVRAQPPGTWLPMQVRRGEETLDVVVRFPPET
ncbi:MAG: ChaN family lipoprotein, partial [Rhodospirillaceae bacterium]